MQVLEAPFLANYGPCIRTRPLQQLSHSNARCHMGKSPALRKDHRAVGQDHSTDSSAGLQGPWSRRHSGRAVSATKWRILTLWIWP